MSHSNNKLLNNKYKFSNILKNFLFSIYIFPEQKSNYFVSSFPYLPHQLIVLLYPLVSLHNDLIAEMLEAFTHNVLFIRRAYPYGIFQKRRLYSCVVYRSRFPPLNEYIANVIRSAIFLHKLNNLNKFEVVFYLPGEPTTTETKLESYFFDFSPVDASPADKASCATKEPVGKSRTAKVHADYGRLTQFEEKMRSVILTLDAKCRNLDPLPDRFLFKINLHTNQLGHCKLTEDEKLQVGIEINQMLRL